MPRLLSTNSFSLIAWAGVVALSVATEARATEKFKAASASCELFWYSKHTPTLSYDISDEHRPDYALGPDADYFREAAERTRDYCDRTSYQPQTPFGPPRRIVGVWFESNDGQFKALYNLDTGGIDPSAGITNLIGDRYAAEQRHRAQLEEIRTRETRAQELRLAEAKAAQDKAAAEIAREDLFLGSKDLQIARLGVAVSRENFATIDAVRANPYHYGKLGLAVIRTRFDKMLSEKYARFGNAFAPIYVHIKDVDRFTQSGETVMLALKVTDRREVERSYGSLPEVVVSAIKAEPIVGEYLGAYTCPVGDCRHLFDMPTAE